MKLRVGFVFSNPKNPPTLKSTTVGFFFTLYALLKLPYPSNLDIYGVFALKLLKDGMPVYPKKIVFTAALSPPFNVFETDYSEAI